MQYGSCIRGVGAYLPEEVRGNDWWPKEWVESWVRKNKGPLNRLEEAGMAGEEFLHPLLRAALKEIEGDPFDGLKERRVAPADMLPSDMEIIAAKEAMQDAGVSPEEIGLVMTFSMPSDHISDTTANRVHHELGLVNATAYGIHVYCFSLNAMMNIAHQFIANGVHKYVLLLTSCKWSNGLDYTTSMSVMSGDAATGWVLGRCKEGEGFLTASEHTESEYHDTLLWVNRPAALAPRSPYAFGPDQNQARLFFSANNPSKGARMVARIPYWAEISGTAALKAAGWTGDDVDLYIPNAATVWYGPLSAKVLGIKPEAIEDNILRYGHMGGSNLPVNLYEAVKRGRTKPGTRILFFGHGAGCSFGSFTFQWPAD